VEVIRVHDVGPTARVARVVSALAEARSKRPGAAGDGGR
jgi:dihydropteroate synthase